MKSQFSFILFFSFLATSVYGQIPWPGDCPNIQPISTLNSTEYAGVWYEAERYFFFPEITGSCISVQYDLNNDGSYATQIRVTDSITNQKKVFKGTTSFLDTTPTGSLQLNLELTNPAFPSLLVSKNYNYEVIDTDYTTYSIKWSCFTLQAVHFKSLWILSRDRSYPASVSTTVHRRLDQIGLWTTGLLQRTDQNCITENVG